MLLCQNWMAPSELGVLVACGCLDFCTRKTVLTFKRLVMVMQFVVDGYMYALFYGGLFV